MKVRHGKVRILEAHASPQNCFTDSRRDSERKRLSKNFGDEPRHRTDESYDIPVGGRAPRSSALPCAWKADPKCLHRSFNGRFRDECLNEHELVNTRRGSRYHQGMAARLQRPSPACNARRLDARRVLPHSQPTTLLFNRSINCAHISVSRVNQLAVSFKMSRSDSSSRTCLRSFVLSALANPSVRRPESRPSCLTQFIIDCRKIWNSRDSSHTLRPA